MMGEDDEGPGESDDESLCFVGKRELRNNVFLA